MEHPWLNKNSGHHVPMGEEKSDESGMKSSNPSGVSVSSHGSATVEPTGIVDTSDQ